jgi:quinoprotein glucose dehydrogenase
LEERLAAVECLTAKNQLTVDGARTLCQPLIPPEVRAAARTFLMKHDPKNGVLFLNEAFLAGSMVEKQAAVRTLNRLPGNGNDNEKLLLELARRLGRGTVEAGIQVEVLEALQRRDIQSRSPWRRATDSWNVSLPMDRDPLAAWRMTMADGDPVAGRLVFESHPEANCTACHAIQGVGGTRGPDLDNVASRLTAGGLLQSLIHPGAKLARGFETILRPPSGIPVLPEGPVSPADPADPPAPDESSGPRSLMPPAGTLLTLRELRDLIAYLCTLQPTPP